MEKRIDYSKAIIIYRNWPDVFPKSDRAAIIQEFGERHAETIIGYIDKVTSEAFETNIDWDVCDLITAGERVYERMAILHPELSEDALRATSRYYMYCSK
ncbi:hypothetical protein [Humidesulfovibrio mexicanus]|uniref:hypothetical protein n=1 Tax=Humidesulfovibrio mexicanus TaxID=147047 RepID=UPI001177915B|nr:hypothetical protein [Humidesulfovibrio mexicanus]